MKNNWKDLRLTIDLTVDMDEAEGLGMTLEDVCEALYLDHDPEFDQYTLAVENERTEQDRDYILLAGSVKSVEVLDSDGTTAAAEGGTDSDAVS